MRMVSGAIGLSSLDKGCKKYDKTFGATIKLHYTYYLTRSFCPVKAASLFWKPCT